MANTSGNNNDSGAVDQALDFYQAGNFEAAASLYNKMLTDEPDNPEVHYMLSLCRHQQGKFEQAISHLHTAIDNHPENGVYHYALAGLMMRTGKPEKALNHYTQVSKINQNEPRSRVGQGYALLALGRLDEARDALKSALRAVEDQPEIKATALAHLGVIELQDGDLEEATSYLQRAVEINANDAYIQTHLGRAFHASGQTAFAVQCFRNVHSLNEGQFARDPQLNLWYGQSLEQTGDIQGAMQAWQSALQHGHEHPELLYRLAGAYVQVGQPHEAIHLLLRAHKLVPDNMQIVQLLGTAYQADNQSKQAITILQQAGASDRACQRQLAQIYLAVGKLQLAQQLVKQLQADGEDDDFLLAAKVAVAAVDADAAHRSLNQLGQAQQGSPAALWLRASAYALNDTDQALATVGQLLEIEQLPAELHDSVIRLQARLLDTRGEHDDVWKLLNKLPQGHSKWLAMLNHSVPAGKSPVFDRDVIRSWPPVAPGRQRFQPVFVHAPPGASRNALLAALDLHPDVVVVQNRMTVSGASGQQQFASTRLRRELITSPCDLDQLSDVTETDWMHLRTRYRKQISKLSAGRYEGKIVIDGMDIPASGLSAIQRYFPEAVLICVSTDIDDLQLRWKWSGYKDIPAMQAAWEQEQALLEQARHALEINWIDIDAAQLTAAPQQALQPLLDHFKLDWQEQLTGPLVPAVLLPPFGAGANYRTMFKENS